ncbi:hypothetical protein [Sphingomonas sp. TZW2008]|uniref:hypothetical protein n=1 Tax=Sphingomonas sp. TZW2008 TaxID=1917973 RepID=UPI000A26CB63|nr:hypothetical protein [Sphingomonas sp. TZW2008]
MRELAAAIYATPGRAAQFQAELPKAVAGSPRYRAGVAKLAAMFGFAMGILGRERLIAYLRVAVAT